MAELADALDLGSSVYDVQVQVLLSALSNGRNPVFTRVLLFLGDKWEPMGATHKPFLFLNLNAFRAILSMKGGGNVWAEKRNGNTRYKEKYKHPLTGKTMTVSVTLTGKATRAQEREARKILDEKIDEACECYPCSGRKLTLADVVKRYRIDQKRTVSETSYIRNYHALNTIMKMLGSDVIIDNLNARYVRERFVASGKANGTLNEHMVRLKAFMRWAYRNDYVEDVTWLDKLVPYKNEEKKEILADKYLEAEQLETLLDAMTVKRWHDLTLFMALTGMRSGEAIGLQVKDIDLKNRTIHVRGSYSATTGKLGETKTRLQRDVYMQDELYDLCRALDCDRKKWEMATGIRSTFFFSDNEGKPCEYCSFNKYLGKVADEVLDREHKTTTHILRHTHVALMAEQGVSLDAISRRVGHSNSKITKNVYFHVTQKMRQRDNAEFEKVTLLNTV